MHTPGLMMDRPLLISSILEHAEAQRGATEIVSRETHGGMHRYTFRDLAARSRRLANALAGLGFGEGDAVATLAWNNHRHLETYYGVSGSGLIVHTCNPRLHADQLIYIINHAADRLVFFDSTFLSLIEQIAPHCPRVQAYVCLTDRGHMPTAAGLPLTCYEDFIAGQSESFDWPDLDERCAAALCYTSGTTGNPKGALYSHRAMVLNAMSICAPGVLCLSPRECVMPIVPMFHINGWCIPYAALIAGAKLVLLGPKYDGVSLCELMQSEGVTGSAAVPTVWRTLMQYVEQQGVRFSSLQRICMGGAAAPTALIAKYTEEYGVEVQQGWGMTETVAVATISKLDGAQLDLPPAQRHEIISRQGKTVFGVQIKVIDESGQTLPRDGESQGEVMIRGHWIVSGYYKADVSPLREGWFPTGDIGTIDPSGVLQIRDRAKDLIKTGGEWISSLDLENVASSHPGVAAAAVVGVPHPKWQERPLLFIVRKAQGSCERDEILDFVGQRVARWWVPDEVIFVDSLPVGGTGKVQKNVLREKFGKVFE